MPLIKLALPPQLDWVSIGCATAAVLILFEAWYSPFLFGRAWQSEAGTRGGTNVPKGRYLAPVILIVTMMSTSLSIVLGPDPSLWSGLTVALAVSTCAVALSVWMIAIVEQRTLRYVAIHAGYLILAYLIMGAVIGAV